MRDILTSSVNRQTSLLNFIFDIMPSNILKISLEIYEDDNEKEMFLLLQTVSGIGPRMALNAISVMGEKKLSNAIANADIAIGPVVVPAAAENDFVACPVADARPFKLNVFPDVSVAIFVSYML